MLQAPVLERDNPVTTVLVASYQLIDCILLSGCTGEVGRMLSKAPGMHPVGGVYGVRRSSLVLCLVTCVSNQVTRSTLSAAITKNIGADYGTLTSRIRIGSQLLSVGNAGLVIAKCKFPIISLIKVANA